MFRSHRRRCSKGISIWYGLSFELHCKKFILGPAAALYQPGFILGCTSSLENLAGIDPGRTEAILSGPAVFMTRVVSYHGTDWIAARPGLAKAWKGDPLAIR